MQMLLTENGIYPSSRVLQTLKTYKLCQGALKLEHLDYSDHPSVDAGRY